VTGELPGDAITAAAVDALAAWMREWGWLTDMDDKPLPDDLVRKVCQGATQIVLETATPFIEEKATAAERDGIRQLAIDKDAVVFVPVPSQITAEPPTVTLVRFADFLDGGAQ
jgi:hypothetical protein